MTDLPKNAIAFQFAPSGVDLTNFAERLAEFPLATPGPLEMERVGFLPFSGNEDDPLAVSVDRFLAFAVGLRSKVIPGSVLRERLQEKVREVVAKGGTVTGKERKRLRDAVKDELMRQAFCKLTVIRGWIDRRGWVFFDTSSNNNAELALGEVRKALGSFPAVRPADAAPATVFQRWVREKATEAPFGFGDSCVLALPDSGSRWTGKGVDVCGVEVEEHLNAGSSFERMGLTFNDRLSFTFDVNFAVKQLRWLDTDDSADEGDDAEAVAAANMLRVAGDVSELLNGLVGAFCEAEAA